MVQAMIVVALQTQGHAALIRIFDLLAGSADELEAARLRGMWVGDPEDLKLLHLSASNKTRLPNSPRRPNFALPTARRQTTTSRGIRESGTAFL
jgi:hypothetical protein